MRIKLNCHGIELWAIVPVAIVGCFVGEIIHVTRSVEASASASANTRTITLGTAYPGSSYALTVAVKDPSELRAGGAIDLTVKDAKGDIERKWLHPADLDFYLTLKPREAGPVTVSLSALSGSNLPRSQPFSPECPSEFRAIRQAKSAE